MGSIKYFLGCSSPEGFHSFFGELCPTHSGGYTYIIKGGPGTGKSSLMKRINSALTDAGRAATRPGPAPSAPAPSGGTEWLFVEV